jgi:hypothetical protein
MTVDQIKLGSVLEHFRDVKVFGYFGVDGGILFISLVHHGMQVSAGQRIPGGDNVTSQPRATSPSVTLLATVSQAPYCRGGVRQATGDRIATLLLGSLMLFDGTS